MPMLLKSFVCGSCAAEHGCDPVRSTKPGRDRSRRTGDLDVGCRPDVGHQRAELQFRVEGVQSSSSESGGSWTPSQKPRLDGSCGGRTRLQCCPVAPSHASAWVHAANLSVTRARTITGCVFTGCPSRGSSGDRQFRGSSSESDESWPPSSEPGAGPRAEGTFRWVWKSTAPAGTASSSDPVELLPPWVRPCTKTGASSGVLRITH